MYKAVAISKGERWKYKRGTRSGRQTKEGYRGAKQEIAKKKIQRGVLSEQTLMLQSVEMSLYELKALQKG